MPSETTAQKNIQKLQRAIVDGLEDVKAQDIQVFDSEHLSALFERVIIASGSSNRQTKALAASVRDAVREAGFAKPRIEGEENGEWIIVDCGQAVVHIMQPAIRQYYTLEDIWGEKPVRMRIGKAPAKKSAAEKPLSRTAAKTAAKKEAKALEDAPVVKKAAAKKPASKAVPATVEKKPATQPAAAKKPAASAAKSAASKPRKTAATSVRKPAATQAAASKTAVRKKSA